MRGLCPRCYTRLLTAVKIGHATWEQLLAAGRALPANRKAAMACQGERQMQA
jgi:hypothetical protein